MAPYVTGELATLGEGLTAHAAVIGPLAGVSLAVGRQGAQGLEALITWLTVEVSLEGGSLRKRRGCRWGGGWGRHQASGGAACGGIAALGKLPEPQRKVQRL